MGQTVPISKLRVDALHLCLLGFLMWSSLSIATASDRLFGMNVQVQVTWTITLQSCSLCCLSSSIMPNSQFHLITLNMCAT